MKTWHIVPQNTQHGPVVARWTGFFPYYDKKTDSIKIGRMQYPIICVLINNVDDGKPLAVQWSGARGWHIKYPPRQSQALAYVGNTTKRDYWNAPVAVVESVEEFPNREAILAALGKRCGDAFATVVVDEIEYEVLQEKGCVPC